MRHICNWIVYISTLVKANWNAKQWHNLFMVNLILFVFVCEMNTIQCSVFNRWLFRMSKSDNTLTDHLELCCLKIGVFFFRSLALVTIMLFDNFLLFGSRKSSVLVFFEQIKFRRKLVRVCTIPSKSRVRTNSAMHAHSYLNK